MTAPTNRGRSCLQAAHRERALVGPLRTAVLADPGARRRLAGCVDLAVDPDEPVAAAAHAGREDEGLDFPAGRESFDGARHGLLRGGVVCRLRRAGLSPKVGCKHRLLILEALGAREDQAAAAQHLNNRLAGVRIVEGPSVVSVSEALDVHGEVRSADPGVLKYVVTGGQPAPHAFVFRHPSPRPSYHKPNVRRVLRPDFAARDCLHRAR